jgi:hypothetical protein
MGTDCGQPGGNPSYTMSAGANTGGGGGGAGHPPDGTGGSGGSGVVIIQNLSGSQSV